MKYTEEQKYRRIQRNRSLYDATEKRTQKLREDFPVEVEYKDGFFIIESKMNYDNVYTQEATV